MKPWSLLTVLSVAACVVRLRGWVDVKTAYDKQIDSTGHTVMAILEGKEPFPAMEQRDCDRAAEVLSFLRSRDDLTRYDRTLRERLTAYESEGVPHSYVSYVASAIMALKDGQRHYANRDNWESIEGSQFVGTVGDQLRSLSLTVIKKISIGETKTSSGIKRTYVYTMRDVNGNAYKWKTERDLWGVNDQIEVTSARIKCHEDYQGYKFTEITSCRTKTKVGV